MRTTSLISLILLLAACGDKEDEVTDGTVGTTGTATTTGGTTSGSTGGTTGGTTGTTTGGTTSGSTGGTTTGDADGDGYTTDDGDCDDADAAINPDAEELCDGIDNDCDDSVDEDDAADAGTWYTDGDGDGYGDDATAVSGCTQPSETVEAGGDCDDTDVAWNPGADESDCTDPNDYNCDGSVGYADDDGDGFAACEDCDDSDRNVNAGAPEFCDGIDNNCDGDIDEDTAADAATWFADADNDGYGSADDTTEACEAPLGYTADNNDCDDSDRTINPDGREVCDDADNDCDGAIDEDDAVDAQTWYADDDRDGYGDEDDTTAACDEPPGYVEDAGDCDDRDGDINPDATERCDGDDNDCDGSTDEDDAVDAQTWYADDDRDGFGDEDDTTAACDEPFGYVEDAGDCDDRDSDINPDATELCDGDDNDCDGTADEDDAADAMTAWPDLDGDGYGDDSDPSASLTSCTVALGYSVSSGDCDDTDAAINPSADEYCDGVDNDCNGSTDGVDSVDLTTWYYDGDLDDYGDAAVSTLSCNDPGATYVADATDCDDGDDSINPGADEYCDGVDQDCDGVADDAAVDASWLADDADGDGYGAVGTTDLQCEGIDNEWDCDDATSTEPHMVDASSAAATPDGSANAPWTTIQDGIDNASTCVVVAAGTYTENVDFGGRDVLVTGVEGADSTIIQGGGAGPVVTFASGESAGAELTGFTLSNGDGYEEVTTSSYSCGSGDTCTDTHTTYCGGGIYIDGATPTLSELLVTDNDLTMSADLEVSDGDSYYYYSYGGGLCLRNTLLDVSGVDVWGNYADDGGGLYLESGAALSMSQSLVVGNTAESGAAFEVDGGSLTLVNVLSAWNAATTAGGGVLAMDASVSATNVTIAGDDAPLGGGLYAEGTTTATVVNTIIEGADSAEGVLVDSGASFSGSYNNVYANATDYSGITDPTGTSGNISTDPVFTSVTDDGDDTNDDWSLGSGSPSVDAGDPASVYTDSDGTTNDQGAYGGPDGDWE